MLSGPGVLSAVVALWVLAGAPEPRDAGVARRGAARAAAPDAGPPPFRWKIPQVLAYVEVPAELRARGVPVRFRAALVKERVEVLAPRFARAFADSGLYLAPVRPEDVHLTALDVESLVSYTVAFEQTTPETTTLIWGEADLARADDAQGGGAAVPPGARSVLRSDVEGLVTTWFLTDVEPAAALDFYAQTLPAEGWVRESPNLFRKGQRQRKVNAGAGPAGTQVLVLDSTQP